MPQHDYDLANATGAAFRADLNNALLAIVAQNSGASAPATMFAYQWWADTTTGILKQRNAANSAWVNILTMSSGSVAAAALSAITGLGTNVATALAIAIGSAGAPVVFNGALGTPSSGTLTNCTGYAGTSLTVFNAAGDLLYATADNVGARLAIGTARQALMVNAGATAPAWANPITLSTEQASTSGTALDFTGIPAGARRITIMFVGVSLNGTDNILVQLGDAGGVEATGYLGSATGLSTGTVAVTNYTTGFGIPVGSASNVIHGSIVLNLVEDAAGFTWVASGNIGLSDSASFIALGGSKSLSAELDRVRVTTLAGANTFDAGAINISYE